MKKSIKCVLIGLLIAFCGFLIFLANAFWGNPVSVMLTRTAVNKYIEDNYADMDLIIEKVGYNFKNTDYFAIVKSNESIDTHFSVYCNGWGKIISDSYSDVSDKYNTYARIDNEYRALTDTVFNSSDFPYESDIAYGIIAFSEKEDGWNDITGISLEELEIDKIYDIRVLAAQYGRIVFYANDDNVTLERASEILLGLKKVFREKGIPFYSIDFTLQKPKNDNGSRGEEAIYIRDFLFTDIYEQGLTERVAEAYNRLSEYYDEQDKKIKQ